MASGYGTPGWYVDSVIGQPISARYARSPADFARRYGNPPLPGQWYATQAEAQKAIGGNFQQEPPALQSIPNPFSWTGAIAHWLGKLVLDITDVHMYISLGWIILGILLMLGGLYLLVRLSEPYAKANQAATGVVAKL